MNKNNGSGQKLTEIYNHTLKKNEKKTYKWRIQQKKQSLKKWTKEETNKQRNDRAQLQNWPLMK